MNTYTELIDKYINNELSETDKQAFENALITNTELKTEYELQLEVIKGIKRLGLKNQTNRSFKKVKTKKIIKKALIGLAIALTVTGAVLMAKSTVTKNSTELLYQLNEQGKTTWAEADKKLESQVFKLNPLRDTIIETQHGIVLAIPANAFLNAGAEHLTSTIDLEIKEAMTAFDMMTAGLSTLSNGKLLETGGMFYVNARIGNENLTIDKSKAINVNVPNTTHKNDMMLFSGERKEDGGINWIDPKPLKKRLVTVDITSLNFYPEHFLDSVKGMGFDIKNKKLTDSIYYSFGCNSMFGSETAAYSFDDAISDHDSISSTDKAAYKPDGEKLFKKNCSTCHLTSTQKLTGPGLAGILDRAPKGSWLHNWILNSDKVTKSGDAYAHKIKKENGYAAMTVFEGQLSDKEVDAIIDYVSNPTGIVVEAYSRPNECPEIDPSKIRAIWDKKFNRTILATKEFEERLKTIFKTCEPGILNLYIKNLSHNLYEIDSTAAAQLSGDLKTKFLEFYARRDGGVDISDQQSKKLNAYFEEKRNIYAKAAVEALAKMYKTEAEQTAIAYEKKNKQAMESLVRNSKTFAEELDMNMDEAYRQLGKKKPSANPPVDYLSANITQTGWNNVDRYVIESTINRSTLDYTDPQSGKKAVIKYEPITITVSYFKEYDKVVSYMIPDKLSSFQLMTATANGSKESLNELMNYAVITIGFKGDKRYYHELKKASAQNYNIDLASITEQDLEKKLNSSSPLSKSRNVLADINFQAFDIKESLRQNKINKREEIRERLYSVVFPCSSIIYWQ